MTIFSLAAPEVVILTTSGIVSDSNVIKMMKLLIRQLCCQSWDNVWCLIKFNRWHFFFHHSDKFHLKCISQGLGNGLAPTKWQAIISWFNCWTSSLTPKCTLWCQKQVPRACISNFIPQFTVGCNYLCMPKILASGTRVIILIPVTPVAYSIKDS